MAESTAGKLYYSIGEACEICGLEPHVLRFWEGEFPQLKPRKSARGTRRYRREDIELIGRIKRLVHDEKYTLEGARRRLKHPGGLPPPEVEQLRKELREILEILDRSGRGAVW